MRYCNKSHFQIKNIKDCDFNIKTDKNRRGLTNQFIDKLNDKSNDKINDDHIR